ncbi:uncharacterized protein LOC119745011 [Patiria miniata]|uniref:C-type lectin domain-containing protein n=1 Tax=Patiria miniata TaxID=46514 RepID=A0A914BM17_PATMI|nr:uncharacterized protein LOC119745011 [Patiria miniata]
MGGDGNTCYMIVNEGKSNHDAQLDCIEHGGHLAYIESEEEQSFLETLVATESVNWIGLIWAVSWLDGTPLRQDWLLPIRKPSASLQGVKTCFSMRRSEVIGRVCSNERRFICEIPNENKECLEQYAFGGSCYRLNESRLTHRDAQQFCNETYNGHLPYIETREELNHIVKYLQTVTVGYSWIGLIAQHKWMDGTTVSYRNLQRDTHNRLDWRHGCFSLSGKWKREDCATEYGYICERNIVDQQATHENSSRQCSTTPTGLTEFLRGGSLCIHTEQMINVSDSSYVFPALCECGTGRCLQGCACVVRDNAGGLIACSCGACSLTYSLQTGDIETFEFPVLSSSLTCDCINGEASSSYQFQDGVFTNLHPACSDIGDHTDVVASANITVIVVVPILGMLVLVLLVIGFRLRRRWRKILPVNQMRTSAATGPTSREERNDTGGPASPSVSFHDDQQGDHDDVAPTQSPAVELPADMDVRPNEYDYADFTGKRLDTLSGTSDEEYVNKDVIGKGKQAPKQVERSCQELSPNAADSEPSYDYAGVTGKRLDTLSGTLDEEYVNKDVIRKGKQTPKQVECSRQELSPSAADSEPSYDYASVRAPSLDHDSPTHAGVYINERVRPQRQQRVPEMQTPNDDFGSYYAEIS